MWSASKLCSRRRSASLVGIVALSLFLGLHNRASAIDILPRDYFPLPSGTSVAALYYFYNAYDRLNLGTGGTYRTRTDLQSHLGVLRYIYYGDILERSYALQAVLPFGTVDGRIAGQDLGRSTGTGDVLFSAGVSLLPRPNPRRNLGIVLYASLPTGQYSAERTLNLGANRWNANLQVGYTTAVGSRFWFDVATDAIFYDSNTAFGRDRLELKKVPSYQGQLWFSYVPDLTSLVSVGFSATLGGAESVARVRNGLKTESQQVRLAYSRFLTESFQLVGGVTHDVHVAGGFRSGFGLTLRAAYLF